jgi:hypothetical protein
MDENIEQLNLFPLETVEIKHSSYRYVNDPYWDELVGEQLLIRDDSDAPQHTPIDEGVGEQIDSDINRTAPQHNTPPTKHTHWIEKYWVERGQKKHHYWRYMWMEGRKIRRCYLGRYGDKVTAVSDAIANGLSPDEIREMITNWTK